MNDVVEMHAVREAPPKVHDARCSDGTDASHQLRAATLLAVAVAAWDVLSAEHLS